jgi:hypothetical protein
MSSGDNKRRSHLPIPTPERTGLITYDAKDPDTKFAPIEQLRPPKGAPNVLIVLIDDAGFGSSSAFGGPCQTPNAEKLAAAGRTMISADITAFVRRSATIVMLALSSAWIGSEAYADEPASYVGAQACAGCHAEQFDSWKGSHHALAMQKPTEATVLGDFADAKLEHFGITTTFFRDGDKFMVRTDGPDGALHEYAIAYMLGSIRCSNI